ncbi:S8 family peptidase [Aestuariibacter salexigens]|uniref:S8 family peptidase n=1 Tax=Aestuariibacter salexigens TaxID=226010 RepID=UPI0004078806|nr:S8 family peptidase [Aestuariibacter salexigens]
MNQKLALAVSAALMSMTAHSASELASTATDSFTVDANTLQAASAISFNKGAPSLQGSYKPIFTPEKDLANGEYVYLVQLEDKAVALYDGGVEGFEATNPQKNFELLNRTGGKLSQKLDVSSQPVQAYMNYLDRQQKAFLQKAEGVLGKANPIATYKLAVNGFAMKMTQDEAVRLAKVPGVRFIERDKMYKMDTDVGPGLIGAPSVWDGSATNSGVGALGEGVVVGVLDSGINSDHPSFADVGGDGFDHTNPLGEGVYLGDCAGDFPEMCNDKLIGVYSYPDIVDPYDDESVFPPGLPKNGEDYNGHGSHTAGTAAGNILYDVPVVNGEVGASQSDGLETGFVFESISGVAPHANIIAYHVCQPGDNGDPYVGCYGTPMVSAVEDAIEAGIVDVINFSISGGGYPWNGALNEAWLAARNSGIFLAQSAGNSGPEPATTAKHAPWVTAVAASTHGRSIDYPKELTDFSGGDTTLETLTGNSASGGITASIVYAGDYENPNDPDNDPAQCLQPFPENTFSGEIVVCDRGAIARVQKAINVADGGAGGYVLANLQGGANNIANDVYVIPGIHIDADQSDMLRDWLASGEGHTATITAAEGELVIDPDGVDNLAGFSSRGPNASIDTLTPAITGPGVNIYAAYSDEQYGHTVTGTAPADFAFLSGTSMSGPHVAGAAALVKNDQPTWTPDNIRSALMMTASTDMRKEDGVTPADWFDMGAGRVQVDLAVQSGLVMDETAQNYADADPNQGGDPKTLNLPSMTNSNCVGVCSWTRTVTATKDGSWTVSGAAVTAGLEISVSPETFDLASGESQEITVTVDAFNAPSEQWSFGVLNLTSAVSPDLHMPISVIASTGNIPETVSFEANRNQDSYLLSGVQAVEITDFQSTSYGMTKASVVEGELAVDSANGDFLDDLTDGLSITTAEIPEGAKRFVAEIVESASPDLDLWLLLDANEDGIPTEDEIVAFSASGTAFERVDVTEPPAGMYWVIVQNWAASSEGAVDAFKMVHATVDGETGDNLSVVADAAIPQLTDFDLRFAYDLSDGAEGDYYFGAVELGTDAESATNLGLITLDAYRGADDVRLTGSADGRVEVGDQITYAVEVAANFTAEDRTYDISVTLPDGVAVVDPGTATVDGNTLSWMQTQESLLGKTPTYSVTTNASDAMCRNPEFGQGNGAYLDLAAFGIPFSGVAGDDEFGTFGVPANILGEAYPALNIDTNGFITFGAHQGATWFNQLLPDAENEPHSVIAPFWRDLYVDNAEGSGISVATAGPNVTIIEWDNMKTVFGVDDIADFQVVFINNAGTTAPNIIFSYDNMEHYFPTQIPTTIGYEDMSGESGLTTHYVPYFGVDNPSIGDIGADAQDGLQVCFYLQDVPDEPTPLSFTVEITEDNLGGPLQLLAMSSLPDNEWTAAVASEVNANVEVEGAPIVTIGGEATAEMMVIETRELSLPGSVTEPNGDDYDIVWTQVDGPAAVIAGNGLAEAKLIAPEVTEDTMIVLEMTATDSNGNSNTAVANVMVMNNLAPSLNISAPSAVDEGDRIFISVTTSDPEGDDVTVYIDGAMTSSLSTTAPGTNEDTTVSFVIEASDGLNMVSETVTVTVRNKKSGSMGLIALLLLPLIAMRRRRTLH